MKIFFFSALLLLTANQIIAQARGYWGLAPVVQFYNSEIIHSKPFPGALIAYNSEAKLEYPFMLRYELEFGVGTLSFRGYPEQQFSTKYPDLTAPKESIIYPNFFSALRFLSEVEVIENTLNVFAGPFASVNVYFDKSRNLYLTDDDSVFVSSHSVMSPMEEQNFNFGITAGAHLNLGDINFKVAFNKGFINMPLSDNHQSYKARINSLEIGLLYCFAEN